MVIPLTEEADAWHHLEFDQPPLTGTGAQTKVVKMAEPSETARDGINYVPSKDYD
jgi:hypothetical protein